MQVVRFVAFFLFSAPPGIVSLPCTGYDNLLHHNWCAKLQKFRAVRGETRSLEVFRFQEARMSALLGEASLKMWLLPFYVVISERTSCTCT